MIKININTRDIQRNLNRERKRNLELAELEAERTALDLQRRWQLKCPVDTGAARNSIQTDLANFIKTVWTNCKYMGRLNRGHSKQAAAGFIEDSRDEATRRI